MKWDHLSEHDKSLQILRVLKLLSLSDGKLNHGELHFLREVGVSHGLTKETIDRELTNKNVDIIFPETEQDRMSIVYYMVFLMKSDNFVDAEEEKIIYHYGLKLGFREGLLREFIRLAKKYLHTGIPVEEMLEKIKKYMN